MLIGEITRKSGMSKDGIRHYEALGLIHSRPVQAGTRVYRDYLPCTWERLALIAFSKKMGFQLKEVAEYLDLVLSDQISREDRAARLAEKLHEIDQRISDLQEARALLTDIVERPDKSFVDLHLKKMGLWLE